MLAEMNLKGYASVWSEQIAPQMHAELLIASLCASEN